MSLKNANTKSFLLMVIVLMLMPAGSAVTIRKIVQLQSLSIKPETVFLTKFDIGVGSGSLTINYR